MARTLFVSRHPGAVEWARRRGHGQADLVEHLDPATVRCGDTVIGTLPIHVAAAVCARGGRYLHLALDLPPEARGRPLSADDMERFGARLEAFQIGRFVVSVQLRRWAIAMREKAARLLRALGIRYQTLAHRWPRTTPLLTLLGFTCSVSWLSDSLAALVAGEQWSAFKGLALLASIGAIFVLFVVAASGLFSLRHRLLSTPAEEFAASEKYARPILIMGLSHLTREADPAGGPKRFIASVQEALNLAATLPLAELAKPARTLEDKTRDRLGRLPWQQNLRSIWPHRQRLKRLIVVTSPESYGDFGTFRDLVVRLMQEFGRSDFTVDSVRAAEPPVSFFEYKTIVDRLQRIIRDEIRDDAARPTDICIDVTAGTKIFSIAAAITTLSEGLLGSYAADREGDVRMFDARVEISDAYGP